MSPGTILSAAASEKSMELTLTENEVRVLGSLIEKDITTPDYYPLSLNALVNACNQKSNRDPFMQLDENAVRDALFYCAEGCGATTTLSRRRPFCMGVRPCLIMVQSSQRG